jgi:hypothetical protein
VRTPPRVLRCVQREGFRGGQAPARYRAAGGILLAVHLLIVGWIALRPLDVAWVSPANLHLLGGIRADLALGPREAILRIGGGLLLLAPLGVLLPLVGGRLQVSPLGSLVRTVTAAALLSLVIELVQTAVPGRVADIDALLLNPIGVAFAHLAVVPAARAWLRRRTEPESGPRRRTEHRSRPGGQERVERPLEACDAQGEVLAGGRCPDEGSQGSTRTIPRVRIAP